MNESRSNRFQTTSMSIQYCNRLVRVVFASHSCLFRTHNEMRKRLEIASDATTRYECDKCDLPTVQWRLRNLSAAQILGPPKICETHNVRDDRCSGLRQIRIGQSGIHAIPTRMTRVTSVYNLRMCKPSINSMGRGVG